MRIKNPTLLRGLILETGRSYRDLEAVFGIHNSTLANIIAGRRATTRATAERICQELGVEVERVFIADEPASVA